MNTRTKRAAVLAAFLALEVIGLVAWSATATTLVNVIAGAALGLVCMMGGLHLAGGQPHQNQHAGVF